MGIGDHTIFRIYTCMNEDCKCEVSFKEKVSKPWRKVCPFCKKHTLLLDRATLTLSAFVDTNQPKTLGAISDQNRTRKIKEGTPFKDDQKAINLPWWRKEKKVNMDVLRNPKQYIETGSV